MFSEERREKHEHHRQSSMWTEYGHLVIMGTFAGSLYYSFFYLGAAMQFIPSLVIGALIGGIFGVTGTCFFLARIGLQYFMTFSERLGGEILDRVGDDISELRSSGFVSKSLGMILQNYLLERLKRKPVEPERACKNTRPEMNFKKAEDILKTSIFDSSGAGRSAVEDEKPAAPVPFTVPLTVPQGPVTCTASPCGCGSGRFVGTIPVTTDCKNA